VLDKNDESAAYGMGWFDPELTIGLMEPMRTHDDHQRRGLARHILTAGVNRLFDAGSERVKICFEIENAPASHLYQDVGFEIVKETDFYEGPTAG